GHEDAHQPHSRRRLLAELLSASAREGHGIRRRGGPEPRRADGDGDDRTGDPAQRDGVRRRRSRHGGGGAAVPRGDGDPMSTHPVLIGGAWRAANASGSFGSENPATGERLADEFPISTWADCDAALDAAVDAARELRTVPPEHIANFLTRFAERIEARAAELVEAAHAETGLAKKPRLADVELPRTTGQLRQGAAAAIEGSWALPTIDTKLGLRSMLAPIGPVWVFGPNNFPFAFNSVSGGDFVAAIAAGNPVIAKANSSHPNTTRLLGEEAFAALGETGLPPATVQLLYRTGHADGERLVADPRTGATG